MCLYRSDRHPERQAGTCRRGRERPRNLAGSIASARCACVRRGETNTNHRAKSRSPARRIPITQPSGPQFDMRTLNGRPDFGMRGVKSGAAFSTARTAASNSTWPSRSKSGPDRSGSRPGRRPIRIPLRRAILPCGAIPLSYMSQGKLYEPREIARKSSGADWFKSSKDYQWGRTRGAFRACPTCR